MDKKVLIIDNKDSLLYRSVRSLPGIEPVIYSGDEFPSDCECVMISQEFAENRINSLLGKAWEKMMSAALCTTNGSYENQVDLCSTGADDVIVLPMYGKLLRRRIIDLAENTVISGFSSFDTFASGNDASGAFVVEEKDFRNIYKFVLRILERLDKKAQLVEFRLRSRMPDGIVEPDVMNDLGLVVQRSLRHGDICCQNGNRVYVILIGADSIGGDIASQRISNSFESVCADDAYDVTYEIREISNR